MTDYVELLDRWTDKNLRAELEQVLHELPNLVASASYDFRRDLYPALSAIDQQIPGVGMQYAHWEGATPRFPFAKAVDAVVRPLSYVPYHLATPMMYNVMAREVVNDAGAHVEQCVKLLNIGRNRRVPLGVLVNNSRVKKRLGPDLVGAINQYTPSWNVAKHDYEGGGPQSVITLDDAIRNYFVARSLGAAVLKSIGSLNRTVQAIEEASDNHSYYNRGYLLDTRVRPLVQSTKDAPDPGVVEHGDTHGRPTLSQRPELYVTPIHVVATRSFSDWLDRLPYAAMVAVVAAVERLAAYGRRLGPPEVEQVPTRAFPETYVLVPEPPAVGRQVLFAFDPTGRAVLIEGDYRLGKRKRLRAAVRRYRRSRHWFRLVSGSDLRPFTDVVAHLTDEDRAEVNAMRAATAMTSVMFGESDRRDARQRIQLELDYLMNRPNPEIADERLSDNWLLEHNRDIATKIGYGKAVLDHLPVYEDIPTARVQTTEPPKTR